MSVGGHIIEILPMRLIETGQDVVRLWVKDMGYPDDETAVYAEPSEIMPSIGDAIWWQGGKIYFDQDRKWLRKVGYSFDPRRA